MTLSASLKQTLFASVLALTCTYSAFAETYTFTTIDVPGASFTSASGINNAGQIVGSFSVTGRSHGFLLSDGLFTPLDVPGAFSTSAFGINDAGQIVGTFFASGLHGFLATPVPDAAPVPEPASLLLLSSGLAGLAAWRMRRL